MKVLSVGGDASVFDDAGSARARQAAYAEALGELRIIVPSHHADIDTAEGLSIRAVSSRFFIPFTVAREIQRFHPDVITAQDPFEYGLMTYLGSLGTGIPLHVQLHTDMFAPGFGSSLLNRIRIFIASFVLRRARRIRVVSDSIRTSLQERLRLDAPISVLPIYVDTQRFKNAGPDGNISQNVSGYRTKLLVVSRLEREKNVALAIRSFAHAAPTDACLMIAGEGSERGALEDLAIDLGVQDRVIFLGQSDPADLYPIADLVLVPSLYEGYGLVIIEALSAGKPVLSMDVGIAREAGAIIAADFPSGLKQWFDNGPRTGLLQAYPYRSFIEYVSAYTLDIASCRGR